MVGGTLAEVRPGLTQMNPMLIGYRILGPVVSRDVLLRGSVFGVVLLHKIYPHFMAVCDLFCRPFLPQLPFMCFPLLDWKFSHAI